MNLNDLSVLRDMVPPELNRIAQDQIPKGKSKEYHEGLRDAFLHSAKMLNANMDNEESTWLIAALVVNIEAKITGY